MKRRSLFKQAAALAALAVLPAVTFAQPALQAGKDYMAVKPAQPTESGDKIEVIEFFSYGCPHCFEFEPKLEPWSRALPKDVVFKRVPITFNREAWAVLARVYLALDVMGQAERLSLSVFNAVHNDRVDFSSEVARNGWLQKNGVDAAKFNDSFKSFSVQSRLQRSTQLAAAYQIQGVPTLAIDGKYLVAPSMSGTFEGALDAANQMIVKARTERGRK